MIDYILIKLIPGYEDRTDAKIHNRCGKVLGFVGIVFNLLLFGIKLAAGILTDSVAIITDAVNNLSDSTSSVVTLVGFRLSEKPADDEHPYGHARIEYIVGIIISFIILFLGLQMGLTSVKRIASPEDTEFSFASLVILLLSIIIKLLLFATYYKAGKHVDSQTLIATGRDALNDVISTSVILIGAGITMLFQINLDGWMGLLVAIFIVYSGIRLIFETADPLLGTSPPAEMVEKVYNKIMSYDGIIGVHDLQVHNYGAGQCFATVHCEVPAEIDIRISHDQIDNIEHDFAQELNIHLVIHLDPVETQNEHTIKLSHDINELAKGIYPQILIHDFRVVPGITHSNVIFDIAVPFGLEDEDKEICKKLSKAIAQYDASFRSVITVDRTSEVNMKYMN